MSGQDSDILMQVRPDMMPILAECRSLVQVEDILAADFLVPFTFFEVTEFSFGMKLTDTDARDLVGSKDNLVNSKVQLSTGSTRGPTMHDTRQSPVDLAKAMKEAKTSAGTFARWKTASADELKKMPPYPVEMDPFEVTRYYDRVSPVLFKHCCDSTSIKKIILIKRKAVGASGLHSYVRMDFTDCLITSINWQHDDPMKEKIRFVFREVMVVYQRAFITKPLQQALMIPMEPAKWAFDAKLVSKTL